MKRDRSVFDGYHQPRRGNGRGHSARQLQDEASYDQERRRGGILRRLLGRGGDRG